MAIWTPVLATDTPNRAQAIADAIAADVAAGRLRPGDRLPPQRILAYALGVSPDTVMRAYAEAARRGHVGGEVGRGTFVRAPDPWPGGGGMTPLARLAEGPIDFSRNLPFVGGAGEVLASTLAALAGEDDLADFLDQGEDRVRARHAEAGAAWLGRVGLPARADRILLATGAQQGVFAAFLALLEPRDVLLVEQLTYVPVKAMARHLDVRLAPLAMDRRGILPEALDSACRRLSPKALYCTPTVQTPTTVTMDDDRRREIAGIAAAHDLVIVEDDVFGHLPPSRPLPIAVFAPERTVFATSVSKSMAPGLRVGFVQAPESLLEPIAAAIALSSWRPPPLMGEIACRWIRDGTGLQLNQAQRTHAARRQAMARTALAGHAALADPHGLHLWLPLPEGWSAGSFTAAALESGVRVNPAEVFAVGPESPAAVRLSLSYEVADGRVVQGLAILAALLKRPPPAPLAP